MSAKIEVGQVWRYGKFGGEYEIIQIDADGAIKIKSTISVFEEFITKTDLEEKFIFIK